MARRILVALDESEQANSALHYALTMYPDADHYVVHVNDPREWAGADDMGGFYSERAYEQMRESAEQLLEEANEIAASYDTKVSCETVVGRPANMIVEYAEENDIEHIVIGSHGRRGLARFLLGSVAERVVRRSPVSVTIIRSPGDDN